MSKPPLFTSTWQRALGAVVCIGLMCLDTGKVVPWLIVIALFFFVSTLARSGAIQSNPYLREPEDSWRSRSLLRDTLKAVVCCSVGMILALVAGFLVGKHIVPDTEFTMILFIGPALILMFVGAFCFLRVLTALVWGVRR